MSLAQQIPVDQLTELLPFMTPEQSVRALRLIRVMQSTAPAPKPVSATELLALERDLSLFVREAWKILVPGRE